MNKEQTSIPIDTKELPKYLKELFSPDLTKHFRELDDISEKELAFLLGQQSVIQFIENKVNRKGRK